MSESMNGVVPSLATPRRASPCLAKPGHAAPRPALPRRASLRLPTVPDNPAGATACAAILTARRGGLLLPPALGDGYCHPAGAMTCSTILHFTHWNHPRLGSTA